MKDALLKSGVQITDVISGVLLYVLISKSGLLTTSVVFFVEVAIVHARHKFMKNEQDAKRHEWILLFFSSIGIVVGYFCYPIVSEPKSLGIAALLLVLIIHNALFLIMNGLAGKRSC